ncbi:2Fe-2S iron-sulfur cluster-binding protein [Tepidiphilus succinatimandens]|uniref:2Fe-2S iron-sulfur cluster-binding protein n=1 Tax=Tepidiphilus succinatimandens TaxID=224436 RepID=UPI00112F0A0C|nr:2Fe-2S iron-sulfur cluster-binding protein [Tepidiphilus succinatimandens]
MFKKIIELFSPGKDAKVKVIGQGIEFNVDKGKTVLEGALNVGIDFPHDCKVGTCGKCKYKLINGKISELSSSAKALSGELYQSGYRLACQSIPKCDLDIEVDTPLSRSIKVQEYDAVIQSQLLLTHDIIELTIIPEKPIAFQPGQYADIINNELGVSRSYSFATPPKENGELKFHIRHVPGGKFSGWLFGGDRTGTHLRVRGPYGQFHYHESNDVMVCVAGGTGLAPIKCILESMTASQRQRDVFLFFGARRQKDLYCLEEIEALRKLWGGRFEFIPILSEEPHNSDWQGRRGMITEHLREFLSGLSCEGYLCGPPPMVDAVEAELIRIGVSPHSIYADRFYSQAQSPK